MAVFSDRFVPIVSVVYSMEASCDGEHSVKILLLLRFSEKAAAIAFMSYSIDKSQKEESIE